jgi:tetratricopeptide (TPR) repeat protein
MKKTLIYLLFSFVFVFVSCDQQTNNGAKDTSSANSKELKPEMKTNPVKLKEQNQEADNSTKSEAVLFRKGAELLKAQKWEEGIDYFNQVISLNSHNSKAYYNRGFGYYGMKDYGKAWEDLAKAVELDPKDSTAFLYMGLIKYYQNDFEASIIQYTKAIDVDPKYATAYYNRGISKGQLKDFNGAIDDFNKAIELKSDYPDAYFNRGLAKYFMKKPDKACEDWHKAKDLGSSSASKAIDTYCK